MIWEVIYSLVPKGIWPAGSGQRCTWFVREADGHVLFNPYLDLVCSWERS